MAKSTASDNPCDEVSGRAPRHHCVRMLGQATPPTLDADADPIGRRALHVPVGRHRGIAMASSVCGLGKRPGELGVRRCRLLLMLLSVGRNWPRGATAPVEPTLLGARLSSARAR